jgi:hypothetical protein
MKKLFLSLLFLCFSYGTVFADSVSGGFSFDVSVTPTVQNAAYSSGNAIGGLQSVKLFRGTQQPSGILNNIQVQSQGGATTAITLYIFRAKPSSSTTCTDKSAFSLAAGDVNKLIPGAPPVLTPAVVGAGSTVTFASEQLPIIVSNLDSPFTNLIYVCPVVGGTVTPGTTTDLVFTYGVLQD